MKLEIVNHAHNNWIRCSMAPASNQRLYHKVEKKKKKKKKKTQVSWKFRVPKSGPLAQQGVVHIGRLGLDILQVLLRALCILLLQAHLDLGVTD